MQRLIPALFLVFLFYLPIKSQVAVVFSEESNKFGVGIGKNATELAKQDLISKNKNITVNSTVVFYDYPGGYNLAIVPAKNKLTRKNELFIWYEPGISNDSLNRIVLSEFNKKYEKSFRELKDITFYNVPKTLFPGEIMDEIIHYAHVDFSKAIQIGLNNIGVLDSIKTNENEIVLYRKFGNSGDAYRYYNFIKPGLDSLLVTRGFVQTGIETTKMMWEINTELPIFTFFIEKAGLDSYVKIVIQKSRTSQPPQVYFIWGEDKEYKLSSEKTDTVIAEKEWVNGEYSYFIKGVVKEKNQITSFKMNGKEMTLDAKNKFRFLVKNDFNQTTITITTADNLENKAEYKPFIIFLEKDPPDLKISGLAANSYENEIEVWKNENGTFILKGEIHDDSPIRYLKINSKIIDPKKNGQFDLALDDSYNFKNIEFISCDYFGNKIFQTFKIILREKERALSDPQIINFESKHSIFSNQAIDTSEIEVNVMPPYCYVTSKIFDMPDLLGTDYESEITAFLPVQAAEIDFKNNDFSLEAKYLYFDDFIKTGIYFGKQDDKNYFYCYGINNTFYVYQVMEGVHKKLYEMANSSCYNYFRNTLGVSEYNIRISGYNDFYRGAKNDPNDYLFFTVENDENRACKKISFSIDGVKENIYGKEWGIYMMEPGKIALKNIKITSKFNSDKLVKKDEGNEKIIFGDCYTPDKDAMLSCVASDYLTYIFPVYSFNDSTINDLKNVNELSDELKTELAKDYAMSGNIIIKKNLTRDGFENILKNDIPNRFNPKSQTKLIIYIITHGTTSGELIFSDGRKMEGSAILDIVNKYAAHNVLVIVDACYSGKMWPGKINSYNPEILLLETYMNKSRILLTSADESATTGGLFTKYFIQALRENNSMYFSIDRLFNTMTNNKDFINDNKGTVPKIRKFDNSTTINNSFFFIKK